MFTKIFKYFLVWRVVLFFLVFLAILYLPLQKNFLGGGMREYLSNPYLWSLANFDGEHYLSIAKMGYANGEQAFFPLYPLLIRFFGGTITSGVLISNLSFIIALIGLYKLIRIDFSEEIARLIILLLLIFPTSFYFGGVYTESLFLAEVVWAFYFARSGKWYKAGVLGMLASSTRVIGLVLFSALVIEYLTQIKYKIRNIKYNILFLAVIPIGILLYMAYLNHSTGDPLAFIHTLTGFGEQRSATPIILPQVFYRYIFKILPSLDYSYWPIVFTTMLEFLTALVFLVLSVIAFFRLRLSYAAYLALGFLVPTLSGSFSSLPRYVLVLFPGFILMAIYIKRMPKVLQFSVFALLFVCLGFATALFSRGYWIS